MIWRLHDHDHRHCVSQSYIVTDKKFLLRGMPDKPMLCAANEVAQCLGNDLKCPTTSALSLLLQRYQDRRWQKVWPVTEVAFAYGCVDTCNHEARRLRHCSGRRGDDMRLLRDVGSEHLPGRRKLQFVRFCGCFSLLCLLHLFPTATRESRFLVRHWALELLQLNS